MKTLLSLYFLAALATSAQAHVATTVGPTTAPHGGKLLITLSNDSEDLPTIKTSLWLVRDAAGAVVFTPTTPPADLVILHEQVYTETWDLRDQAGQLVVPGAYEVEVRQNLTAPLLTTTVNVVSQGAGLVLEGTASLQGIFGLAHGRKFYLTSPSDAGKLYLLLASDSAMVGMPTCGPPLPLDATPLLYQSLVPGSLFLASFGVLDGNGESMAPQLKLPNNPFLIGYKVEAAFLVLDPASPCIVTRASNALSLVVVP